MTLPRRAFQADNLRVACSPVAATITSSRRISVQTLENLKIQRESAVSKNRGKVGDIRRIGQIQEDLWFAEHEKELMAEAAARDKNNRTPI